MEFASFEEALQVCMTAAEGSPEQAAALAHCLEKAPPDLRLLLARRLGAHEHTCGCGCSGKAK